MFDKLAGALRSWTIWFNNTFGVALLLIPVIQEQMPNLQPYFDANTYKYLMLALIVGNILLRFKTTVALENK